jgi:uridylate kinase
VTTRYRRILLKLSGELLGGASGNGFDGVFIHRIAQEIAAIAKQGVEVGVVIGGGNIFRGTRAPLPNMDRVTADHMGILGTVINAICLQDAIERQGAPARVMTAIEMRAIAEPYIRRRALRHLEKGRIVVFGAGTGNPFFTTDTAAALRASEIGANVLIKATKVDGVYDKDPLRHRDAVRFERLSYQDVLSRNLGVMDAAAISLCRENDVPILVLNIEREGILNGAVAGETVGTLISHG